MIVNMKSKMQENPPNKTYKLHKAEIPGKPSTYQRENIIYIIKFTGDSLISWLKYTTNPKDWKILE